MKCRSLINSCWLGYSIRTQILGSHYGAMNCGCTDECTDCHSKSQIDRHKWRLDQLVKDGRLSMPCRKCDQSSRKISITRQSISRELGSRNIAIMDRLSKPIRAYSNLNPSAICRVSRYARPVIKNYAVEFDSQQKFPISSIFIFLFCGNRSSTTKFLTV